MRRIGPIVAAALGISLALLFLGYMVVSINRLPLWVIIGGSAALMLRDLIHSLYEGQGFERPSTGQGPGPESVGDET